MRTAPFTCPQHQATPAASILTAAVRVQSTARAADEALSHSTVVGQASASMPEVRRAVHITTGSAAAQAKQPAREATEGRGADGRRLPGEWEHLTKALEESDEAEAKTQRMAEDIKRMRAREDRARTSRWCDITQRCSILSLNTMSRCSYLRCTQYATPRATMCRHK